MIDGSDGGDATDITYLSFGNEDEDAEDPGRETDHLGVLMVSYRDGKVDVFLDVEKVEGRWENKYVGFYLLIPRAVPDESPYRRVKTNSQCWPYMNP